MKSLICASLLLFFLTHQSNAQSFEGCTSVNCHESVIAAKNIHPALEDDCTSCHEEEATVHPSTSGNDFSLMDELPELCYTCHDARNTEQFVHMPVEEGDCTGCHSPHSSDSDHLLLENSVQETCSQCHDVPEDGNSIHAPVKSGLCINCHNPHESTYKYLLTDESNNLCFSCHTDMNIESEEYNLHVPFEDDCRECHNPHSSQYSSLLLDNFPTGNYASGFEGNYSLCFTCHDEEAFTEEETTTSTNFRNGNVNLHYIHVNQEKSRSCINCHDVHRSKNEYLITDEMSFGKIKMKLNFQVTETGGSCLPGCHGIRNYNSLN